jgi:hypothetical protein
MVRFIQIRNEGATIESNLSTQSPRKTNYKVIVKQNLKVQGILR